MRESGIFGGSPLAPPQASVDQNRVGLEQQIASHADVFPY